METLLTLSAADTSPLEDTASTAPLFTDVCEGALRSKDTEVSNWVNVKLFAEYMTYSRDNNSSYIDSR